MLQILQTPMESEGTLPIICRRQRIKYWQFQFFCPRGHTGPKKISSPFTLSPTWVSFQDYTPDISQTRDHVAVLNSDPCIAGTNSKSWTDQQAGSKNTSIPYSPEGSAGTIQSHDTHLRLRFQIALILPAFWKIRLSEYQICSLLFAM